MELQPIVTHDEPDETMVFYSKLSWAFATMAKNNLFVRENYWCCQTCALAALDRDTSDEEGYAYYHKQDGARLASGDDIYIRYGSLAKDKRSSLTIGQEVWLALKAAGIDATWSGDAEQAIVVHQPQAERPLWLSDAIKNVVESGESTAEEIDEYLSSHGIAGLFDDDANED